MKILSQKRCNKDAGNMTIDDKKLILLTHNRLRNQVATQSNAVGPKLPFATNMIQMYYTDSIGSKAQKWADQCVFKHSSPTERKQPQFATGENIYRTKFIGGTPIKNWQKAIESWFAEIKDFGGKSVISYSPVGAVTGHFTQLIWAYSYFLGCGFSSYSESPGEITHVYVCQYGPVGNINNFPIYKAALSPGCDCPDGMGCNNTGFPGLCCPSGHCNHNSIEYNGEPFSGTNPDIEVKPKSNFM